MKGKVFKSALTGLVLGSWFAFPSRGTIMELEPGQDAGLQWRVVNDGVMGGLSQGSVAHTETGELVFAGNLSLENNGGFSSIRSDRVSLDLGHAEGLVIRVKGDGRTYQLRLSNSTTYRGREAVFMAEFATMKGEWIEVHVPFDRFVGTWFGRLIPDATLDPSDIRRLGFLLADKKPGPFALRVDFIRTYGETAKVHPEGFGPVDRGSGSKQEVLREARRTIESAIALGVPVFNRGQHARTADIYEECLVGLARSLTMEPDLADSLERLIEQGRQLSSPTDRAWFYRRALDASARYLLEAMG
jgi:monofunctional biosynthetic peptidoglycan transglycosylase